MQRLWDLSGISLSALCLVHCLALPALSVAAPLLVRIAEAEWVHWLIVALAAPVALAAIAPRLRERPFPWATSIFAIAGVGLLFAAVAFAPEAFEAPLTLVGGIMLALAHAQNWRRLGHAHAHVRNRLQRGSATEPKA
jgi:hypothetical protein